MRNILFVLFASGILFTNAAYGQVIYEIYPSGGAAGSTYQYDAIVLQGVPGQSLSGKSLQYIGATGSFSTNTHLFGASAAFNAQGYFYLQAGSVGSGAPLPFTPNEVFGYSLSNNGGKLALCNNTINLSGTCPLPNANILDFVGYGPTANCSEGSAITTWAGSLTSSMKRTQETNNNANDFTINTMPLGVELVSFEVQTNNQSIDLTWTTASEKNNDFFSIERSGDGKQYVAIGTKDGGGTTSKGDRYTFTDEAPLQGANYYRLKQVDTDGNYEYSPIRMVQWGKSGTAAIYPNPVTDATLRILYTSSQENEIQISLMDGCGKTVYQQSAETTKGDNQLTLNMGVLPANVYWLKITDGAETQVIPVVVQ